MEAWRSWTYTTATRTMRADRRVKHDRLALFSSLFLQILLHQVALCSADHHANPINDDLIVFPAHCGNLVTGEHSITIGTVCTTVTGDNVEVVVSMDPTLNEDNRCCLQESHICNAPFITFDQDEGICTLDDSLSFDMSEMHGFMCPEDRDPNAQFQLDGHASIICDKYLEEDTDYDTNPGDLTPMQHMIGDYSYGAVFVINFACGCKPIPHNAECPDVITPVTCGVDECHFDNACLAGAAGYDLARDCVAGAGPACPDYPVDTMCDKNWDPVECGHGCPFYNPCFAEAAGYDPVIECLGECRTSIPTTPCVEIYDPLICGPMFECEFENYCWAEAALYDVEKECVRKCREFPMDTECPSISDPVTCDHTCEFSNPCWAAAAGYTVESDCVPGQCGEAPPPDRESPCFRYKPNPLRCGPMFSCEYDNECYAEAAGYNLVHQCVAACKQYNVDTTVCPDVSNPVTCGSMCVYDNECWAAAAGYDVNTECMGDCNAVPDDHSCMATEDEPVLCDNHCPFKNPCLADAAGYNSAWECISV